MLYQYLRSWSWVFYNIFPLSLTLSNIHIFFLFRCTNTEKYNKLENRPERKQIPKSNTDTSKKMEIKILLGMISAMDENFTNLKTVLDSIE